MAKKIPVIISYRNGKQYIRSKPVSVAQTENSRRTASGFGKTSRLAAQLVETMQPLIPVTKGMMIYRRLFSALVNLQHVLFCNPQQQGKETGFFKGFRFVPKVGIENRLKVDYQIDYAGDKVIVHLPAFVPRQAIIAPAGCSGMELKMMAISCKPLEGEVLSCGQHYISIAHDNEMQAATVVEIPVNAPVGTLTLVIFSIKYEGIEWGARAKAVEFGWMPGGVVAASWCTT